MTKHTKRKKKVSHLPIIIAAIVAVIIIALLIYTFIQHRSDTILKGVHMGGIELSGYTIDEAETLLAERLSKTADEKIEIIAGEDSFSATYADFGASYNCRLSAETAYGYGHSGFSSAIIPSIKSLFGIKENIELSVNINNRTFDALMASSTDYNKSVEASYEFVENAIRVTNGQSAYTINPVTAKNALETAMKNLDFSTIKFEKENIEPIPLDIDGLIEKHSKDAVSATYYKDSEGNIRISDGNDKVTVNEKNAKSIIDAHSAPGETFEIPAIIEFAEFTSDDLNDALFRDVLSSYKTSYSSSNANRSHNVALAASSINGKILLPGEKLSYNTALGRRTPEAGYKMAGAYSNGQTVQEYGGGICQVSSTLYNAVLLANLKIEERLCHMFRVGYVPMGLDATVDYGTVDFVFSNDTDYPIKVSCITTSDKQVICEITGTKTENFKVTMETTNISSVPYSTKTVEDPTLPLGEEKVMEEGSNGSKCTTYRVVSIDGEVVSRTKESQSYYMPHNEVIHIGTMPVEEGEISEEASDETAEITEDLISETTVTEEPVQEVEPDIIEETEIFTEEIVIEETTTEEVSVEASPAA